VNPWLKNCEHIVKTLSQNINVVCFIYPLSQSQYSNILSLKKSLFSRKNYYSLTLLFLWSYNNGTTGKKWALTRKKNKRTGFEKLKTPHSNFSLLTFRQIHMIFGHNSWFLEGTRLMRKNTYTVLSSHTTTKKKLNLYHPPLTLPFLSFCITQKPFLLPFPRSSFECFYRSGNTSKNYTHFSCALAMSLPSPGHALRIRSTAPILDWISTRLFRMPTWKETARANVMESILMNA